CTGVLCAAFAYSRYIDWPSFSAAPQVRAYLPASYLVSDAHHYAYNNFMDNWELYRFTTTPDAIAYLANSLDLAAPASVHEFPLIVSRPPPYWWHPEALTNTSLYRSAVRASDGHLYDLLYSVEDGTAYLVRYDG
ncbi:MAG TPA: hypothetical protein VMJ64_01055, partial [Anaerolineales bacterium]|nr:hypothetical protein [Anaerolineales bacterium]